MCRGLVSAGPSATALRAFLPLLHAFALPPPSAPSHEVKQSSSTFAEAVTSPLPFASGAAGTAA